jgi:protein tyrosine/serine phosphatase
MRCSFFLFAILVAPFLSICTAQSSAPSASSATQSSAPPVSFGEKLSVAGVPNAGKIDGSLYRGGQPHKNGLPELKKIGITTIVDLREEDRGKLDWERKQAASLGMRVIYIPVGGWSPPSNEQVARFLSIFRDHPGEKVFVHCHFGDDRTGVFVAAYRISRDRWTAEQAVKEMYFFGFHGTWHPSMKSYVLTFPSSLHSAPSLAPFRATAP